MRVPNPYLLLAGLVAGVAVYVLIVGPKRAGEQAGSAVVGLADGVVTGVTVATGQLVGIPATNADKARLLMDQYAALPWYEQVTAAFKISAYASAADYLKWSVDHSYRPAKGAY